MSGAFCGFRQSHQLHRKQARSWGPWRAAMNIPGCRFLRTAPRCCRSGPGRTRCCFSVGLFRGTLAWPLFCLRSGHRGACSSPCLRRFPRWVIFVFSDRNVLLCPPAFALCALTLPVLSWPPRLLRREGRRRSRCGIRSYLAQPTGGQWRSIQEVYNIGHNVCRASCTTTVQCKLKYKHKGDIKRKTLEVGESINRVWGKHAR